MKSEVRTTIAIVGGLLLLAGVILFFVPAVNIWPSVLMFWSVGLGLLIGAVVSANAEAARSHVQSNP